jgi:hypothetical protein
VYLYIKNLRIKQLSKGLDNVKVRLFLISKRNRPVTYTLELLLDVKIYPRFHVNKLELADLDTLLQKIFRYELDKENEFEVEEILDYEDQEQIKCRMYLVKWLGYDDTENT